MCAVCRSKCTTFSAAVRSASAARVGVMQRGTGRVAQPAGAVQLGECGVPCGGGLGLAHLGGGGHGVLGTERYEPGEHTFADLCRDALGGRGCEHGGVIVQPVDDGGQAGLVGLVDDRGELAASAELGAHDLPLAGVQGQVVGVLSAAGGEDRCDGIGGLIRGEGIAAASASAGATIVVTVTTRVQLPLVPELFGLDRATAVPVQAQAVQKVSRLWGAE